MGAVRDRHEAIQKIERQLVELAELFNDMERAVVEQEQNVVQVEQSAVEAKDNITHANVELTAANKSAAAARKKKWISFWIVGMVSLNYLFLNLLTDPTQFALSSSLLQS